MKLEGKKIGVCITGSFCTHSEILPEIENMIREGADIIPVISESVDKYSTRFGTSDDLKIKLEAITGKHILKNIVDVEPIGPRSLIDILIIMPCTGNTLAKIANGITDTAVTMACKAQLRNSKPVVLSIATNDALGINAKNIALLMNLKYIYFVPFCQDNSQKKPTSMIARHELIIPAMVMALEGKQIQPVIYKD